MTRPTPVRVAVRARLARTALFALLALAAACASGKGARCAQREFLYTERVATRGGRIEERPVYGCASGAAARPVTTTTADSTR